MHIKLFPGLRRVCSVGRPNASMLWGQIGDAEIVSVACQKILLRVSKPRVRPKIFRGDLQRSPKHVMETRPFWQYCSKRHLSFEKLGVVKQHLHGFL